MFTPRAFTILRLWVLACFMASVGVATAAPLVNPQAIELVCTSNGGIQMRVLTDEGSVDMGTMGMDCPLCTPYGAPPASPAQALPSPQPLAHALQRIEAAHITALTAAPLPARGPPHFT